jgi:hypothetical protein
MNTQITLNNIISQASRINYNLHNLTEDGYKSIKKFDNDSYEIMIYLVYDIISKLSLTQHIADHLYKEIIPHINDLRGLSFNAKNVDEYEREIINKLIN